MRRKRDQQHAEGQRTQRSLDPRDNEHTLTTVRVEVNLPAVARDCRVGMAATSEIKAAVASREALLKYIFCKESSKERIIELDRLISTIAPGENSCFK